MIINHTFKSVCVNWDELLAGNTVSAFLKALAKQAKTSAAHKAAEPTTKWEDIDVENDMSPMYFGLGVEVLAEAYFKSFGSWKHFIGNVEMSDQPGNIVDDYGVDGMAVTTSTVKLLGNCKAEVGSPVYIQVKGTLNRTKIYKANDGSRIPNFMTNAMSHSRMTGQAYQARYIVFTTGKELHYTLANSMANGLIEEVNINEIEELINKNVVFWNEFRMAVGLAANPIVASTPDKEFIQNMEDEEDMVEI